MRTTIACLALLISMVLASTASAEPVTLEKLWNLDPGSRAYITTDNTQRGIAYNPVTKNLLLVNRAGSLSVNRIDGTTGADEGKLDVTGISGGTFALSYIGVADDGVIYGANLTTNDNTTAFKIYRWADENAAPTVAFSGTLVPGEANPRWGDNMDIRGSGNNTQLLFGQGRDAGGTDPAGTRIAVFGTADNGVTLTPTVMAVTGMNPGETRGGVAFGRGDTFFFKGGPSASSSPLGTTLRYGNFNLAAMTAAVTATGTLPSGLSGFAPLGSLPEQDLLGAIQVNTPVDPQPGAQNFFLFDVTDPANPVVLDSEPFVAGGVRNANGAGAVDFGDGMVFALDTNNGLYAFQIVPEPSTWVALAGLAMMAFCLRRRWR